MELNENIPAESQLDLPSTESPIPTEIWSRIISFLSLRDRCRVECVSHQLCDATKATWSQVKSLSTNVGSAAEFATLLRRCGSHLEEITIERRTEAELFQLCPILKTLTFTSCQNLSLATEGIATGGPLSPEAIVKVQSFIGSMIKLERLQFLSMDVDQDRYVARKYKLVKLEEIVPMLFNLPSLRELHLPLTMADGRDCVSHIGALQQTRVLSITVPYGLNIVDPICKLHQLEQLYLSIHVRMNPLFGADVVTRLAESFPNLNSLPLQFGSTYILNAIPVGCIDALIGHFTQLRTLVIVCGIQTLEGVPVDLSQHRYRPVPLNIFVVNYNLPNFDFLSNFTGYSPQIHIIPMPNGQFGEAIDFLSTYDQNDFNFADQKCLQMVKMSKSEWDFFHGRSQKINRTGEGAFGGGSGSFLD